MILWRGHRIDIKLWRWGEGVQDRYKALEVGGKGYRKDEGYRIDVAYSVVMSCPV